MAPTASCSTTMAGCGSRRTRRTRSSALNESGRVVARLASSRESAGTARPTVCSFREPLIVGGWMYVTNLALPLIGSAAEWEADVKRWTIARIRLPKR